MNNALLTGTVLRAIARTQDPAHQVDTLSAFLLHLAGLLGGMRQLSPPEAPPRSAPDAPRVALSPREREVAALLVEGYAALNVAARLGVSEHTVRTYTRRIYRKLNVVSRVQLARAL